jgi:hypothetical protein
VCPRGVKAGTPAGSLGDVVGAEDLVEKVQAGISFDR